MNGSGEKESGRSDRQGLKLQKRAASLQEEVKALTRRYAPAGDMSDPGNSREAAYESEGRTVSLAWQEKLFSEAGERIRACRQEVEDFLEGRAEAGPHLSEAQRESMRVTALLLDQLEAHVRNEAALRKSLREGYEQEKNARKQGADIRHTAQMRTSRDRLIQGLLEAGQERRE